ncbi:hypothetical protein JYU34_020130 [Plutella xylostella]|nr:hypothetical protein JYU34_020130 [Plutella xylostella]
MLLLDPLLHIYNCCLESALYPKLWKITRVIPVPKGSLGSDVNGYRPVAVLSVFAKVFESALQKMIYNEVSSQLSDCQHGFRPGRSTNSNLLSFMSRVVPSVDAGVQVDAAYFDFKKAFDTVDNDILLTKLAAIGCTTHSLTFFRNYLHNRQQYVDFGNRYSEPFSTYSGVNQGSNMGPLEFIIMINDLPEILMDATCLLFADDLKLFLEIRNEEDAIRLQQDIDRVVAWGCDNKLEFNGSKCVQMTFSRAREPLRHQYTLGGGALARVSSVRDLGVKFTSTLSFSDHIVNICKGAFKTLGFVLRSCQGFTDIRTVKALYNALVRSKLESNAVIWAPHEIKYNLMLERIQNKFLRYLYLKMYGVYPGYPLLYPSLFILGMVGYSKIEVRRDLALTKMVFMVFRGWLCNPTVLESIGLAVPAGGRGLRRRAGRLLAVPTARTNLLHDAPLTRAIRLINKASERTDILTCSLGEFAKVMFHMLCVD